MGGSTGALLARWGIGVTASFGALRTNGIVPVLDGRVLGFALALTMIVALGTGFIPVVALVRAGGGDLWKRLQTGPGPGSGRSTW